MEDSRALPGSTQEKGTTQIHEEGTSAPTGTRGRLHLQMDLLPRSEDPPNQGGASSSSAARTPALAMPARAHNPECVCEHCIAARNGDSEDDIQKIYNQFGEIYETEYLRQAPQLRPPLMMAECPSEFDSQKWAVRPAGARLNIGPYFYVNANPDHVHDPLSHVGFAEGMTPGSFQFQNDDETRIRCWSRIKGNTL